MRPFPESVDTGARVGSGPVATAAGAAGHTFVLWPHRSLGRAGTIGLLAAVGLGFGYVIVVTAGIANWPVTLIASATGLGLAQALRVSNRATVVHEVVEITPRIVRVTRVGPAASTDPVEFSAHWVRIELTTDRYVEDRVLLSEGVRRLSIGNFLSPGERRGLAAALSRSLADLRTADA